VRPTLTRAVAVAPTMLILLVAACQSGNGATPTAAVDGASGFVSIHGSSTVEPISSRVAQAFADQNPDFDYEVGAEGTGDGFASFFCTGDSDISDASRPIKDEEIADCEAAGVEFVELKVAYDGMSLLTSPNNDAVDCLSFLDLYALLGPESEGFDNWSDANDLAAELETELGADFGESHAPYPDAPLNIHAPGAESGTYDSFIELAIADIAGERETEETVRLDYPSSADDNVIIEGISESDTSLGWVGYAFYVQNSDVVKAIEVGAGDGCVAPSEATISDGSYPLSRPLFIYVNTTKLADNQALAPFVEFYLNAGYTAVTDAGYVTLPDDELESTRSAWAAAS